MQNRIGAAAFILCFFTEMNLNDNTGERINPAYVQTYRNYPAIASWVTSSRVTC